MPGPVFDRIGNCLNSGSTTYPAITIILMPSGTPNTYGWDDEWSGLASSSLLVTKWAIDPFPLRIKYIEMFHHSKMSLPLLNKSRDLDC
jgi:hypothetical protein